MIRTALMMLCLGLVFPTMALGQDIDAEDRGWYRDDGFHNVDNENYLTGIFDIDSGRTERKSFFVFDLVDVDSVRSATLRLFLPTGGYDSADASETFTIFDYTGDLNDLVDGNAGTAGFDDLGSGVSFGSADLSVANEDSFIDIELNAAGRSFLTSAIGTRVVLGGAVTSLTGTTGNEWVFGETDPIMVPTPTLQIVAVPEPSSIALFGLAFAVVTSRRKRSVSKN